MRIEISQSDLSAALSTVAGVVERRQTLPILANVLLHSADARLRLSATDLELAVETQTGCSVEEEGSMTVPARKLVDFCRSLAPEAVVKIRTDGDRCIVSSGRTRFTLSSLPAGDFPTLAGEEEMRSLVLPAGEVKRLLDKTAFAMAQQDVRYYLNGVLLEIGEGALVAVATDGHRLSKCAMELADADGALEQLILPAKTVSELRRLLDDSGESIEFRYGERTVEATFGDTVLSSKLIDGKYPEYQRVIPKGLPRMAVVDRELARTALQRAAILSNEKYKGVRISFGAGALSLQAQNPEHEVAEDELEADYDGESVPIGFNVAYLVDVLQAIAADRVEIAFQDADSSSIWRGAGNDTETFVVMPMRL